MECVMNVLECQPLLEHIVNALRHDDLQFPHLPEGAQDLFGAPGVAAEQMVFVLFNEGQVMHDCTVYLFSALPRSEG